MRGRSKKNARLSLLLAVAACSWLAVLQADEAAKPPRLSGSISGQIVDRDGKPIAGAEVRLYESKEPLRNYSPAVATTKSSADGSFLFPKVDDSVFIIAADYAGLATSRIAAIL